MDTYPDFLTGVSPSNPFEETFIFKNLESEYEAGNTTFRQKWLYPRRSFNLRYNIITVTQALILYEFFRAQYGKYLPFVVFLPFSSTYVGEYVAVGDGTTTAFNAPGKTLSAYVVKVAGITQTEGAGDDYTLSASGGSNGEAQINFNAGSIPSAGEHITMNLIGYLKVVCRFAEDSMSFQNFYNRIVNTGITLRGFLNE